MIRALIKTFPYAVSTHISRQAQKTAQRIASEKSKECSRHSFFKEMEPNNQNSTEKSWAPRMPLRK